MISYKDESKVILVWDFGLVMLSFLRQEILVIEVKCLPFELLPHTHLDITLAQKYFSLFLT